MFCTSAFYLYGQGRIRVKGTVTSFFAGVHLGHFPAVICKNLSEKEQAELQQGDTVIIEGQVSLGNSGGVYLERCKLINIGE